MFLVIVVTGVAGALAGASFAWGCCICRGLSFPLDFFFLCFQVKVGDMHHSFCSKVLDSEVFTESVVSPLVVDNA